MGWGAAQVRDRGMVASKGLEKHCHVISRCRLEAMMGQGGDSRGQKGEMDIRDLPYPWGGDDFFRWRISAIICGFVLVIPGKQFYFLIVAVLSRKAQLLCFFL